MKKIFLFFTGLAITLGLFLALRNTVLNSEKNNIDDDLLSGDNYVHELNIPIMEVDSLNPILTYNKQVLNLMKLVYEPLAQISRDESLKGVLATNWTEVDDLTWKIQLQKGVKWHNNVDFTARDVIFTIDQIKLDNVDSPYISNIKNIASVSKIDDYTINITLLEKDEFLIYKLTFPIIPENYFKNGDIASVAKNDAPIGTGPFKYVDTAYNIITLTKNTNWWGNVENAKLENIYLYKYSNYGEAIKAYKSANVDLITTSVTEWGKKFGTIGNNTYSYEGAIFDAIVPNSTKSLLSDSSVRKALLYAINRENIGEKALASNITVSDMPIHTNSKNYMSGMQVEYDIDTAKQVLINAGWTLGAKSWTKNNQTLRLSLMVNSENAEHIKIAEVIKENLADINIGITIKKLSWNDYKKSLEEGNFELALASFDIKNELTMIDMMKENSYINYAKYKSDNANKIIENTKITNIDASIKELQKVFKSEVPYIGLYFRNNNLLTNKSVKGGIEPTWSNPYTNILTWCK